MAIVDDIKNRLKEAMKAKNETELTVVRGLLSGFTNELVATGKTPQDEVTDDIVMTIIKRQAKQRKDSISQFEKGGRDDLVEAEKVELKILEEYLPTLMSKEEIQKVAQVKKAELGIDDKAKMGILMGAIMKELGEKADGGDVKDVVMGLFE